MHRTYRYDCELVMKQCTRSLLTLNTLYTHVDVNTHVNVLRVRVDVVVFDSE